jgi:two-component system invasion response regulator UvrY
MIKLMLADDHDLVRTGLKRLLEDIGDFSIVAEATSGDEAVSFAREHAPNVILMDINMPGMTGIDASRKILQRDKNVKIIIVTMNEDETVAQRLLKIGAAGYLTKGSSIKEIEHAIREVLANRRYLTPQIAQQLALAGTRDEEASPFDDLSERELEVMAMILDGKKTNDISDKLCLSPKTVSTYRYRLYGKLNIKSDVELARMAIRHGMLQKDSN